MRTRADRKSPNTGCDRKKRTFHSRKSQLKMTENVAVLFVFFLLLAFGLIFYAGVMNSTSQRDFQKNFELKAIKTTQLVTFLPELQCSAENIVTDACFDMMKIDAFEGVVKSNRLYYYDFFGYSNITISQIYPFNITWNLYENIPPEPEGKKKLVTYVPISLYNATAGGSRGYSFGFVRVEVFEP